MVTIRLGGDRLGEVLSLRLASWRGGEVALGEPRRGFDFLLRRFDWVLKMVLLLLRSLGVGEPDESRSFVVPAPCAGLKAARSPAGLAVSPLEWLENLVIPSDAGPRCCKCALGSEGRRAG